MLIQIKHLLLLQVQVLLILFNAVGQIESFHLIFLAHGSQFLLLDQALTVNRFDLVKDLLE